jgi:hypothetical protein
LRTSCRKGPPFYDRSALELKGAPQIRSVLDAPAQVNQEVSGEALWDALRRLIGEVRAIPNRSLTIECLAVVSGLSYFGDSMSSIAVRHGVSRAAVSKRCGELTEKLDLMYQRTCKFDPLTVAEN